MSLQGLPSATSLMVKSNSLRATKSTAGPAMRLFSGSTATLAPMKPILISGLTVLMHLRRLHVGFEGWRGGVHHHQVAVLELGRDVLELQSVRRRVDQLRALDQSRRLREPGRIPEGAHLPFHLIAGAGTTVEAVEGGGMQKQRSHHASPRQENREFSRGSNDGRARCSAPSTNSGSRPETGLRSTDGPSRRERLGIGSAAIVRDAWRSPSTTA